MLNVGDVIYLRFDLPSRKRVLQPSIVKKILSDGWKLSFENRHHVVKTGEEKLIYYGSTRSFVQQTVKIEAQSTDGPPFILTLRPIGTPISAETRKENRVSTIGSGLAATIEDEEGCFIQNVSLSGLAMISTRKYPVGRCLEIAIRYENEEYVGKVEIQYSLIGINNNLIEIQHGDKLDGAQIRYGLLGVFDTIEGISLQNGLTRITLDVQQRNLKRITGSS